MYNNYQFKFVVYSFIVLHMSLVLFEAPTNRDFSAVVAAQALIVSRSSIKLIEGICLVVHMFDLALLLFAKVTGRL